jgi:outer membrane protein assembly factor BamA
VEFPGALPDQTAFLAPAARNLASSQYSVSALERSSLDNLLPLFLEHGYLKARFDLPQARVIPRSDAQSEASASDEVSVDALLPVTSGKQYVVSAVDWSGNSAVSARDASALFHVAVGQPANGTTILRDVQALTALYHSRGYMAVEINAVTAYDDASGAVRYDIHITEGGQYKMGDLEFMGVDNASKDRLREAWTLREGESYNADYARKFVEAAPRYLPKGLQYIATLSEDLDAKSKTVDVTVDFKPKED